MSFLYELTVCLDKLSNKFGVVYHVRRVVQHIESQDGRIRCREGVVHHPCKIFCHLMITPYYQGDLGLALSSEVTRERGVSRSFDERRKAAHWVVFDKRECGIGVEMLSCG